MSKLMKSFVNSLFAFILVIHGSTPITTVLIAVNTTDTYYVNSSVDSHDSIPGDGICADSTGKCTFRAAIEESNALLGSNSIFLPADTYQFPNLGELSIGDFLTIFGEGEKTTIIDGHNGMEKVFLIDKPGGSKQINVTISNVTIKDGYSSSNGGGIWNDENLYIFNSSIQHNRAAINGGGIYNLNGNLTLMNSEVISNTVDAGGYTGGGGGIYSENGIVNINNTLIHNNKCNDSIGFVMGGGGILNKHGQMNITNSYITGNNIFSVAEDGAPNGGGIYNFSGDLLITRSFISRNKSDTTGWMGAADGGGIANYAGHIEIHASEITTNTSKGSGGGIDNASGTIHILNSLISGNSNVGGSGGGINSTGLSNSMLIDASIFHDNTASLGGAFKQFYGGTTIKNSVIFNNHADDGGGGFSIGDTGTITITNSTLSGNTADIGGGNIDSYGQTRLDHSTIISTGSGNQGLFIYWRGSTYLKNTILATTCNGSFTSLGYNLIKTPMSCSYTPTSGDLTTSDPLLDSLRDNGGNTLTHALLDGSIAIDHGTCTDMSGKVVSFDQRGASRFHACDIGAYEYGGTLTTLTSTSNPVESGHSVSFIASVKEGEIFTPTGVITFTSSNGIFGVIPLDILGQAILNEDSLTPGTYVITATYSGDTHFAPSVSEELIQRVELRIYLPSVIK